MTTCPQCGYTELPKNNPLQTVINEYVQKDNPKRVVCMPRTEDEFTAITGEPGKEVQTVWVKKTIWDANYQEQYQKDMLAAAKKTLAPTPAPTKGDK